MRVQFTAEVLEVTTNWEALDQIVLLFLERRHYWHIEDVTIVERSAWIQSDLSGRTGRRNLETLQKCYADSAYPRDVGRMHSISITVTSQPRTDAELQPHVAKRHLADPLHVFVENRESDGGFIDAMIQAFGRTHLELARSCGWFRLEHLGGLGELPKRVEHIREECGKPLRAFVLTDSDRLVPGQRTRAVESVETFCAPNRIPHRILSKRKIENYIPINCLQTLGSAQNNRIAAYLKLTQDQRNHYEMKKGFSTCSRGLPVIPQEQAGLFNGVPPFWLQRLCGGFGERVATLFITERRRITREAMESICQQTANEIQSLLDEIEQLL